VTNESRFGWTRDILSWDRPHPEVPTLTSDDGTILPGSPLFYAFRHQSQSVELVDNLLWAHGRNTLKFGGGLLLRYIDNFLTAGRDGRYEFGDWVDFSLDQPSRFSIAVARARIPTLNLPQYGREYANREFEFFAQDTFRVNSRLTLNVGIR